VTKNLAINHVKRKMREQGMIDKIKKMPAPGSYKDGGDELVLKETQALVREAVEKLPEKFRSVIVLKGTRTWTTSRSASSPDFESNVKVRVHRARKMMESMLDREEVNVP
jgi:RNA polymerase sigma-70 factor (ECF subfamily)